ncbi:MAG: ribbon-helix-helix protein, CopG family [Dehalococcoidia bacterium]|nr:ribbon-helix-helix protein, CopG family [Dehalococcoidia bacterium]
MATRQIPLRLDDGFVAALDAAAAADGLSRAEWLRRALSRALDGFDGDGGIALAEERARNAELERLIALWRDRHADSQAHAVALQRRLDSESDVTAAIEGLAQRMLPPAAPSGRRRRWWPFSRS